MGLRIWAPDPIGLPAAPAAIGSASSHAALPPDAPVTPRPGAPADSAFIGAADTSQAPAQALAPAQRAAAQAGPSNRPAGAASTQTFDARLATLDWAALRQTVADCRACGLCETRTQTVFGTGHPEAHWMVVGEAPGESEDLQGEPFVGAAGQLLDRMLAALRLSRAADGRQPPSQRVYIANALKCRPPRNRNPTPAEVAQCEPFLVRQIELLRPRIILAMGKFAVQALLRSDEPIGRLRGRVHRYQGVPLIVTYHPAYLLRSLTEKAKAWEDLCLAAEVAEQPQRPAFPAPDVGQQEASIADNAGS
jgi:DNA polymerase